MGILETFSKRKKKLENAGKPDVYQYDNLPAAFRVQIVHILTQALGTADYHRNFSEIWDMVHDMIAEEHGVFVLGKPHDPKAAQCMDFILNGPPLGVLDLIELSFRAIDRTARNRYYTLKEEYNAKIQADEAIDKLNHRFREHCIGYQYIGGNLVRVDSEYIHAEAIIPALTLLRDESFKGAQTEFMRAHKHYREGNYGGAVADAENAFESTVKTICDRRRWRYSHGAAAGELIRVIFDNGLVPAHLDEGNEGIRAMMRGLSVLRNKSASTHGAGAVPIHVTEEMAAYALHLCAANIVFLVGLHKAKP